MILLTSPKTKILNLFSENNQKTAKTMISPVAKTAQNWNSKLQARKCCRSTRMHPLSQTSSGISNTSTRRNKFSEMPTATLEDKATRIKTTTTTQEQTIQILMATIFNRSNSNKWIWCIQITLSTHSFSKWIKLLCSSSTHLSKSTRFHRCALPTYTHLIPILISVIIKETTLYHHKTTTTITAQRTSIRTMETETTTIIIAETTIRIQERVTSTISQTITFHNRNNLNSSRNKNLHCLRLTSRLLEWVER